MLPHSGRSCAGLSLAGWQPEGYHHHHCRPFWLLSHLVSARDPMLGLQPGAPLAAACVCGQPALLWSGHHCHHCRLLVLLRPLIQVLEHNSPTLRIRKHSPRSAGMAAANSMQLASGPFSSGTSSRTSGQHHLRRRQCGFLPLNQRLREATRFENAPRWLQLDEMGQGASCCLPHGQSLHGGAASIAPQEASVNRLCCCPTSAFHCSSAFS